MILAIATSALAEDLNPPEFAGATGSMKGIWAFDEDAPGDPDWPRLDAPDEPMEVIEHAEREGPEDLQLLYEDEFEAEYPGLDFTGIYGWQNSAGDPQNAPATPAVWEENFQGRSGVLTGVSMFGFDFNNFEYNATGHKDISVQITWYLESGTPPPEFWVLVEGWDDDGEFILGTWSEDSIEDIDLGGGWTHSTYYLTTQADPCFIEGDDVNPDSEFIEIGTGDGAWIVAIDEVVIHTICYEGDEPPLGPGGDGTIVVEPNITTIYEPLDAGGPPVQGPVVGNFGVKLGWMPDEPNTVYVTVDPNAEGDGPNEEYKIQGADPCDGTVTLAFNQSNWDVLQKVRIEAIEDLEKEGTENFMLSLTSYTDEINGDPCFVDGWYRMNVSVIDNDVRFFYATPDEIELSESKVPPDPCGTVSFDVRLSHLPEDKVGVWVNAEGAAFDAGMFIIDPNFEQYPPLFADPNRMTFTSTTWGGEGGNPPPTCPEYNEATMTSCWNKPLTIDVHAQDNDELVEAWQQYIEGKVVLRPFSEDPGYRVPELDAQGNEVEDSGGEAAQVVAAVTVEDNECGAKGYDPADIAGGGDEGDEPDCVVNLTDFADLCDRWLFCTQPHDDAGECDKLWNLE